MSGKCGGPFKGVLDGVDVTLDDVIEAVVERSNCRIAAQKAGEILWLRFGSQ